MGKPSLANYPSTCRRTSAVGFTTTNLKYRRQFYLAFPKGHALGDELSWTHYRALFRVADPKAHKWVTPGAWGIPRREKGRSDGAAAEASPGAQTKV